MKVSVIHMNSEYLRILLQVGMLLLSSTSAAVAATEPQSGAGTLEGTVTLKANSAPLHKASVLLPRLGRTAETDEDGRYRFEDLPAGTHEVVVHLASLSDQRRTVTITAGQTATLNFELSLSPVREVVTVTASGREQTTFDTFQAVATLDSFQLVDKATTSIGEVLEGQPGVAKRSFGPGSARPVLRGFDGDRVLVLKDGISTGSLSSQSADHGEGIDVLSLDRIEVVKGAATLLYGSNALGGVVNAVTRHHTIHEHPHEGLSAYLSAVGGTTNAHGGAAAGFEYGIGRWMLWSSGAGQRTGDYNTPLGRIPNSKARTASGSGGFGWFGPTGFFSINYGHENTRNGVPFAAEFEGGEEEEVQAVIVGPQQAQNGEGEEEIDFDSRRHNLRFIGGFRNVGDWLDMVRLTLDYSDYRHLEIEEGEVNTTFDNKILSYRLVFEQKKTGRLSGSFGLHGSNRDYAVAGAEALAPPVDQNSLAAFILEEIDLGGARLQFGGRIEGNRYRPLAGRERSFTGFSGAAGIHVPMGEHLAFVANYTSSYRAPALEELYNNGPHIGNLTFEVGNDNLTRERSNGVDLSLRARSTRVRATANFFYYAIRDFVFLAPTGEIEDGLQVAEYLQGNSRYLGGEFLFGVGLADWLWLNLGADLVNARLTATDTPLPRIPPVRGRVGFDVRYKNLSIRPEAVVAAAQGDLFPTETRTAGYTVFNIDASYTIPQQHLVHVLTLNAFNLGDRLYRNHLSLIKELAPEIGRGVRFGYSVRFF